MNYYSFRYYQIGCTDILVAIVHCNESWYGYKLFPKYFIPEMKYQGAQCLMTPKEKSYVAYCFSKIANLKGPSIDYEKIYYGEKVQYDLKKNKREIANAFGKQNRRSKKWTRPAANSTSSFMGARIVVSELLEINAVLKHIYLDDENKQEMERAAYAYLESQFEEIMNANKFFGFLGEFWELSTMETREKIVCLIIKFHVLVESVDELYAFLANIATDQLAISRAPLDQLFSSDGGYVIALWMLQCEDQIPSLVKSFLACATVQKSSYSDMFVEELLKKKLIKKEEDAIIAKYGN